MIVSTKTGVMVSGTLGRDAEYKLVGAKETPLLKFSVLYGKEDEPDENGRLKGKYIDVNVWGSAAGKMQGVLKRDDAVLVCGQLKERTDDQGRVWRSVDTYGEVWAGVACMADRIGAAQEAPTASVLQCAGDFEPIFADDEDMPF